MYDVLLKIYPVVFSLFGFWPLTKKQCVGWVPFHVSDVFDLSPVNTMRDFPFKLPTWFQFSKKQNLEKHPKENMNTNMNLCCRALIYFVTLWELDPQAGNHNTKLPTYA